MKGGDDATHLKYIIPVHDMRHMKHENRAQQQLEMMKRRDTRKIEIYTFLYHPPNWIGGCASVALYFPSICLSLESFLELFRAVTAEEWSGGVHDGGGVRGR